MNTLENIEAIYLEVGKGIKSEWLSEISDRWYNYVVGLPEKSKTVYLVVIYHNQVFNGGHHQYFSNGYGQFAIETIDTLSLIKATKTAELLEKAYHIFNWVDEPMDIFREKLLAKQIDVAGREEELNDLDDIYYDDQWEDLPKLLGDYIEGL
ncbi:DUF4375 domain-containing protein [Pedobacter frigoris]|uniref:DMP19 family protein n=1 Tax=Pedobacter frigoris TaxID=2571272 RepID=UPI00292DEED5|nr:DUF4375 domain-containing protein [Pedobacter frigoris]